MSDYIVRATAADAQIRAFAVNAKEMVETARVDHNTSPVITAALGTYVTEECTKFILGTRSLDEFDSYVEELKSMQVERAIELKQAAYDRYMGQK